MSWDFSFANLFIAFIASVIGIVVSWTSWKRNEWSWKSGLLEVVRLSLVGMAIVTLLQPEFVSIEVPEKKGTVAVLFDVSGSMKTEDIERDGVYASRADSIKPWTESDRWKEIAKESEVAVEPFDSETFGEKGTNIYGALSQAINKYPNLQSIVLASDGDWNEGGNPIDVARRLRDREIPLFAVGAGSEQRLPDLSLKGLEIPAFAVVGKPVRIPFAVSNSMPQDVDAVVELQIQGKTVAKETVRVPAMGLGKSTFEWRPTKVGEESLTVRIAHDQRDRVAANDEKTVSISLRNESLKVLMVESYPRWEYRYTRNALERDPGVEVSCYLLHPDIKELGGGRGYLEQFPDEQTLFSYDVVFLGDIGVGPNELTLEQCERLRRLVQTQAGGLVLMPGMRGKQSTLFPSPLEELFPVEMDKSRVRGVGMSRPSQFQLTEAGHQSLLTRMETSEAQNDDVWRSLPGFYWYAAVEKAKVGSQVLASHERDSNRFGRIPLIATKTFGNGKVLFMGTDGAWRWRKGVEDKYHYRFWGQVVRWMSYQRTMANGKSMRIFHSPDRPQEGDLITLQANVMNQNGEPLQNGNVTTRMMSPDGDVEVISLGRDDPDAWGLFRGEFTPKMGGEYKLTTTCKETGKSFESTLFVQGLEREQVGNPARFDILRDLAMSTRGQFVTADQVEMIASKAAQKREVQPLEKRVPLWCHPYWAAALLGMLGLFWVGRKAAGLL
jgi:hypothetical protein